MSNPLVNSFPAGIQVPRLAWPSPSDGSKLDDARLALEVYVHRLRSRVAAMAAAMVGLDVLVWTGGVGEHAPLIRAAATDGLGFLGVRIDHERDHAATGHQDLTAPGSRAQVVVLTARDLASSPASPFTALTAHGMAPRHNS